MSDTNNIPPEAIKAASVKIRKIFYNPISPSDMTQRMDSQIEEIVKELLANNSRQTGGPEPKE